MAGMKRSTKSSGGAGFHPRESGPGQAPVVGGREDNVVGSVGADARVRPCDIDPPALWVDGGGGGQPLAGPLPPDVLSRVGGHGERWSGHERASRGSGSRSLDEDDHQLVDLVQHLAS
jgi:hypothetical protein